jgi:hypothetical protein
MLHESGSPTLTQLHRRTVRIRAGDQRIWTDRQVPAALGARTSRRHRGRGEERSWNTRGARTNLRSRLGARSRSRSRRRRLDDDRRITCDHDALGTCGNGTPLGETRPQRRLSHLMRACRTRLATPYRRARSARNSGPGPVRAGPRRTLQSSTSAPSGDKTTGLRSSSASSET